jgi:hypothetical protein
MALKAKFRWRSLQDEGIEHLEFDVQTCGVRVRSTVIGSFEEFRYGATYDMTLAPDWSFRALRLERTDGAAMALNADGLGNWTDGDGNPLPALDGCIDIDLSATPFTNSLPIRRLNAAAGVPQQLRVVWVPMNSLVPLVDQQIYIKLDDTHWHYAAADGSFDADIVVDADGIVVEYPPLFTRT